jgi:hypothetical protein
MTDQNGTDPRLAAVRTALATDLDTLLDLDAGLREVLIAAHHGNLSTDLDDTLQLAAGLHAIVPTPAPARAPNPATPTPSDMPAGGAVAGLLLSLDTPTRLALRREPVLEALAAALHDGVQWGSCSILFLRSSPGSQLARHLEDLRAAAGDGDIAADINIARELVLALNRDVTTDRDRGFHSGEAVARARLRAVAIALAVELAWAPADESLAHALSNARGLVHDLAIRLDRALLRPPAAGHELAGVLVHSLLRMGLDDALGRTLVRALAHDIDWLLDPADLNWFARDIDRARHDFTTADLRGIDLTGVRLDGLRWSAATIWPSEEWRAQALLDSTEIKPGLYEIRRGNTHVPTHS